MRDEGPRGGPWKNDLSALARVCALCNQARIHYDEQEGYVRVGEPTEAALVAPVRAELDRRVRRARVFDSAPSRTEALARGLPPARVEETPSKRVDPAREEAAPKL